MIRRFSLILSFSLVCCLISLIVFAQMPDWKYFRDREGNKYYYDRALKIRIIDAGIFEYKPVRREGIDFYLNTGIELVKEGRYSEGLFYLKSIRILPAHDQRIKNAAIDASKWINYLYKKHGTRFEQYDRESTVLISFSEKKYNLINEKLRYKIILSRRPWIIKGVWKYNDTAYGLKFGLNINPGNVKNDNGYDCIVGIESRIIKSKIEVIDEAVESWRYELGRDNFRREILSRKNDRIIYLYSYGDDVPFSGMEAVYMNRGIIHILRVICHNDMKEKVFSEIKKSVEDMILIN